MSPSRGKTTQSHFQHRVISSELTHTSGHLACKHRSEGLMFVLNTATDTLPHNCNPPSGGMVRFQRPASCVGTDRLFSMCSMAVSGLCIYTDTIRDITVSSQSLQSWPRNTYQRITNSPHTSETHMSSLLTSLPPLLGQIWCKGREGERNTWWN